MSDPFLGQVQLFGFTFCPRGWTEADGQLLPISQNNALFSLYGTTYGGDGRTTFALPDLRGRAPIHFGQGPGLSSYSMGQEGGVEQVVLSAQQLPNQITASVDGITAALKSSGVEGSFDGDGSHSHRVQDHNHAFTYDVREESGNLQVVAFPVDATPGSCTKQWAKGQCPLENATVDVSLSTMDASGTTELGGAQDTSGETVDMGTFSGTVADTTVVVDASSATIDIAGGGQSIENRQPHLAMRYCVALTGIFPSRN